MNSSGSYQNETVNKLNGSGEQEPLVAVDDGFDGSASATLTANPSSSSFVAELLQWRSNNRWQALGVASVLVVLTLVCVIAVSFHAHVQSQPMSNSVSVVHINRALDALQARLIDRPQRVTTPSAGVAHLPPPTTPAIRVHASADVMDAPGGHWELVWADEFNAFDEGKWTKRTDRFEGNWDLQQYRPENVYVENGQLVVVAKRTDENRQKPASQGEYTSGRVDTLGKFSFQYGRLEAAVQLPYGQGIWPAVWMLPVDGSCWPNHGEMDLVEGNHNHAFGTMTWGPCGLRAGCTFSMPERDYSGGFHVFTLDWTPNSVKYSVDGMQYGATAHDNCFVPTAAPFYIIINTAVGGDWPGYPDESTPFPNYLRVDWMHVYQWK